MKGVVEVFKEEEEVVLFPLSLRAGGLPESHEAGIVAEWNAVVTADMAHLAILCPVSPFVVQYCR